MASDLICAVSRMVPSGIGMMYWGMPAITTRDRLERAPILDPDEVIISPQRAAEKIGTEPSASQVRLKTALCVTALFLAWRAVGKKLRQLSRPVAVHNSRA
jgi:hypothetical protein